VDVICATAGRVVKTLPGGKPIVGVTDDNDYVYVLRGCISNQIEIYDKICYKLQRKISVPGLGLARDIAACDINRCAYISDEDNRCVRRVVLRGGAVTYWPVNDQPAGLSVTETQSLLVTCSEVRKVKEFSTDGKPLRQIQLPKDVIKPWHTIQLSRQQLLVCHGEGSGPEDLHRVCLIDRKVLKSYGGSHGSGTEQMSVPFHFAVGRDKFGFGGWYQYGFEGKCVFVADRGNSRVLLLSPSLTYICEFLSRNQLNGYPKRLCFDRYHSRLYVAVNGFEGERVVVCELICSLTASY